MKKVYIAIDESYDANQNGYFVLNALLIKNEKDKISLDNFIEKINKQKGYEEIKGSKVSDELKFKIIKKLNDLDCCNYYYRIYFKEAKHDLNIVNAYLICIINILNGLEMDYKNNNHVFCDFEIDNIGGEKFQAKVRKIIYDFCNKNKIKHNVKFLRSKNSYIVQASDIIASENRIGVRSKIIKSLKKNKSAL